MVVLEISGKQLELWEICAKIFLRIIFQLPVFIKLNFLSNIEPEKRKISKKVTVLC